MTIQEFEKTLRAYCEEHKTRIYVRAQVEGKWKSARLDELSAEQHEQQIQDWLQRRHLPFRLKTAAEMDI